MFSAVCVEDVSFKGRPIELQRGNKVSRASADTGRWEGEQSLLLEPEPPLRVVKALMSGPAQAHGFVQNQVVRHCDASWLTLWPASNRRPCRLCWTPLREAWCILGDGVACIM